MTRSLPLLAGEPPGTSAFTCSQKVCEPMFRGPVWQMASMRGSGEPLPGDSERESRGWGTKGLGFARLRCRYLTSSVSWSRRSAPPTASGDAYME